MRVRDAGDVVARRSRAAAGLPADDPRQELAATVRSLDEQPRLLLRGYLDDSEIDDAIHALEGSVNNALRLIAARAAGEDRRAAVAGLTADLMRFHAQILLAGILIGSPDEPPEASP